MARIRVRKGMLHNILLEILTLTALEMASKSVEAFGRDTILGATTIALGSAVGTTIALLGLAEPRLHSELDVEISTSHLPMVYA